MYYHDDNTYQYSNSIKLVLVVRVRVPSWYRYYYCAGISIGWLLFVVEKKPKLNFYENYSKKNSFQKKQLPKSIK